jgi:hypothetical protein
MSALEGHKDTIYRMFKKEVYNGNPNITVW